MSSGTTTMSKSKREAVLSCLKSNRQLLDKGVVASDIAAAVKRKFNVDVSESYASKLRKEVVDNSMDTDNGQEASRMLPQAPPIPRESSPAPAPRMPPAQEETAHLGKQPEPAVTIIDFKLVDATMDLMRDMASLAERCGGIDNLIVLAQKMVGIGIK